LLDALDPVAGAFVGKLVAGTERFVAVAPPGVPLRWSPSGRMARSGVYRGDSIVGGRLARFGLLKRARILVARHLPRWGVLLLGVACVVLGGVLTADPSLSLSALDWLVGAALLLAG
jgi:hypothetical protein